MYGDMKKTCMHWGIDTGDGWFFLLDHLCHQIQKHIDGVNDVNTKKYSLEKKEDVPQVIADQIKEKFGTLRFYYHGGDDVISGMIRMAEALSYSICENCGKMDYSVVTTKGWIQHLCVPCANEFGKDYVVNKEMKKLWEKAIKERKKPARSWDTIEDIDLKAILPKKLIRRKKK